MDNGSYIKLHRKMLDWEWYDHDNVKLLFLHLLLIASWKESKWHGITLHPGELIRTNENLGHELGKTNKQIRAALEALKRTGEVATRFEAGTRIITVKNWGQYQTEGSSLGSQRAAVWAGEGQAKGSRRAAYKESKESKNVKNVYTAPTHTEIESYCLEQNYQGIDIDRFIEYNSGKGWSMDWKVALDLWYKKGKEQKPKQNGNSFTRMIQHDDYDMDELERKLLGIVNKEE